MSDELNGGGARIHRASAWGVENEAFFSRTSDSSFEADRVRRYLISRETAVSELWSIYFCEEYETFV